MEHAALAPFPSGSLWEDFMIDVAQACHGRRSSLPCRGTSALGQQQWVVKSLVFCFILQKHDNIYHPVGEAYVRGVMSGEAIEKWKRGELEQYVFQPH